MQRLLVTALVAVALCTVLVMLVVVPSNVGRIEALQAVAGDPHSGIASLESQRSTFAQSWDGWLRKVTLQVKAAVDLSRGLQGSKLKRLDGILATDMRKDLKAGEQVAALAKDSSSGRISVSASARRKAAVQSVQSAAHSSRRRRDATEKLDKIAPLATEAEIKASVVPVEGKHAIDPFGKRVGNKVAQDDSKVAADERNLRAAEKKLEKLEGAGAGPRAARPRESAGKKQRRGVHGAKVRKASSAVEYYKEKEGERKQEQQEQQEQQQGGAVQRAKAMVQQAKALVSRAQAAAHSKRLAADINQVMQATRGNKAKAAEEEEEEESQMASELGKLGLAPAPPSRHKAHKWPSQLRLP